MVNDKKSDSSICLSTDTRDKLRMVSSIRGKTYEQLIREKFRGEFMKIATLLKEV